MIKIEIHSTRAVIRSQEPLTVGLRGVKARFSFGKPWQTLIKTAVFRQGDKTVTVADIGAEVTIPWEVLTVPGVPVQIGVYGTDSEGTVAIPTVWTQTQPVRPGTDPEGDPSTEPTPGLWEQLQGKLGSLEQLDTDDQSSLVAAINEANRAVFAVTVNGTEGSYSTECTMIDLLEAWKAGKTLLCFWKEQSQWMSVCRAFVNETGVSTFEFSAAWANQVFCIRLRGMTGAIAVSNTSQIGLATEESKLPNPQKLTFIGAATAEYDGSEEVVVGIPTKVSQLQNDSGFLTGAFVKSVNGQTGDVHITIPSVVSQLVNDKGYLTKAPVTSVNGQTGAVTVEVPTKISQMENDSGFLTTVPVTSVNGQLGDITVPAAVKVIITQQSDGTYTADRYCDQLLEAHNGGNTVYCQYGNRVLSLIVASKAQMIFGCVHTGQVHTVSVGKNSVTVSSVPLVSEEECVRTVNGIRPDGNGDVDLSTSVYDLKDGYGYTEDVYIAEDGTETAMPGLHYKCLDFIPVKSGISYTMYGCGYALYDSEKRFLSAFCDTTGRNEIREFTPSKGGFVRLTVNCDDIAYARFCRTDEKHLEPYDYEPKPSPFFDPKVPCNVHLYGDSNSDWTWMADPSKAWSHRLSTLITSMKAAIRNHRFAAFADKEAGSAFCILRDTGYVRFSAYTDLFGVTVNDVGQIEVWVDGQKHGSIVSDGNTQINFDGYGSHTIELYGISGINSVSVVLSRKQRSFTNHAVYGSGASSGLLTVPDGNVAIVMYGANDRMAYAGTFYECMADFVRQCKAVGIKVYTFTPPPLNVDGETDPSYKQSMNDVIAQQPSDCMNVYAGIQLAALLCGQTLYTDHVHLNELGHKILYLLVAAKLQLAPAMSEVL